MSTALNRTFAAFKVRNFRLFMIGQTVSLCGNWIQIISMSWLVLQLTHSGTQLGLVTAAQFLPNLVVGLWGGIIADRFNKRKILYFTQALFGVLAFILGVLVVSHIVHLWMIYLIAIGFGFVSVVDSPTRQAFVIEMVGKDNVKNAVTLNSTLVNTARIIGPSIAGILIATVGVGPCFIVNALSFIAVIYALTKLRDDQLEPSPIASNEPGQIRAGLTYIWQEPKLKSTLFMMFIIGTFAYEFPVILPLFATITMHGNASTYSAMMAAMGLGAIIGGLYSAGKSKIGETQLASTAIAFGVAIIAASIMPGFITALMVLVLVGALSVLFITLGNTTLQLTSKATMRGRVMSVWSIAFFGTTPIGGPIIGYISDHTNPRVGLATGGISALLAGGLVIYVYRYAAHSNQSYEY
jgi:MFS family permease